MVKIRQEFADVANAVVEQEIINLTVPDGKKFQVLEVNALVEVDTIIYIYIQDERVCVIKGDVNAKDTRRRVVNWKLESGLNVKITASNSSGSTHELGGEIIYDEISG